MVGKPSEFYGLNNYFCECGFKCRTCAVWKQHKEEYKKEESGHERKYP